MAIEKVVVGTPLTRGRVQKWSIVASEDQSAERLTDLRFPRGSQTHPSTFASAEQLEQS
jgi:hypothetical protein